MGMYRGRGRLWFNMEGQEPWSSALKEDCLTKKRDG